ncbi:metallophosphoesterase family protein [Galbibacter sp. PAP.153]|uniref:metallophosphoesterase family protein n=1 Tax=Galbibacter sp. PAP.153 TaxID=3104623 RepID=UPI003008CE17
MNGRTLVVGDIHGAYKALKQVMERAGVSPKDRLVFLGDYVDGWSESPAVINMLIELRDTNKCIFIKGNHDALFLDWLQTHKKNEAWLFHGGQATVDAYDKLDKATLRIHLNFLESLENYHIDGQNRLFVHAGFTNAHGVANEYFPKMAYWDRSLWEMVLAMDKNLTEDNMFYPQRLRHYSEIYIGHTPTIRIGETVPVNINKVWNIDTGAAYKSPLTILDVDTKEYWQSDNVNELYPNEKGRN